jgi:hypothetical protein
MPPAAQSVDDVGMDRRFDLDIFALAPIPARCIQRSLRVKAIIDHFDHYLQMALGLHMAAHDAERPDGLAIAGQEAGDDGVIRPFLWSQTVRMIRV